MERTHRTTLIASIPSLAGGVALVVAPFLQWISATVERGGPGGERRPGLFPRPGQGVAPVTRSLSVQGIDLSVGKVVLVAGIVLIAAGFVLWLSSTAGARTAMGIVGLVAGTTAASLVLYRMAGILDGGVIGRLQVVASRSVGAGMVVALLGALAGGAGCILALAAPPGAATRTAPPPPRSDVPAEPEPTAPAGPQARAGAPEDVSATP